MHDYQILKAHEQRIHQTAKSNENRRMAETLEPKSSVFRANAMSVSLVIISILSLVLFFTLS